MALEKDQMRRYLLGDVSQAESEEVEVRAIEDEGISEEIYVAENELIEDYLEGALSDRERQAFEQRFLAAVERRERVNEIRLLKRFSSGPHRFDLPDENDSQDSVKSGRWLVPAIVAFIVGLIALFAFFLLAG